MVESLFDITQDYSLQPMTLLNSFTDDFIRVFIQLHQKLWKIVRKTYVLEFPFERVARIQSTAYYRNILQIHSGSAQKGKDVLKFQKFQKNICEFVPFSLTLQPCSPEFRYTFLTERWNNYCYESFGKLSKNKNVFSSAPFKKIEICNPTTCNYAEN